MAPPESSNRVDAGHDHGRGSQASLDSSLQLRVEDLPEELRPIASFIIQGERILREGLSQSSLKMCGKSALQFMCRRRDLDTKGTVPVLITRLYDYVCVINVTTQDFPSCGVLGK